MKIVYNTLKKFKIPFTRFFSFYIVAAILISFASIFTAHLTGALSVATLQADVESIRKLIVVLTIVVAIRVFFAALQAYYKDRFEGVVGFTLRENFAKYFLQQPFADFEKGNIGERISAFTNDLPYAKSLISSATIRMVGDFVAIVAVLIYMLGTSVSLTIIYIISFPLVMVIQMLASRPMQKRQRLLLESSAKFNDVLSDSLTNISTVVTYSLEDFMEKRYMSAYRDFYKARIKNARTFAFMLFIGIVSSAIPVLIVNVLGSVSVINNNMSITDFVAFTSVAVTTAFWLANLSEVISHFVTSKMGAIRFNEMIQNFDSKEDGFQDHDTAYIFDSNNDATLEVENLIFSYEKDDKNIIDNVSFSCSRGEKIAIIGSSGSGKSTLLKLLLGLYPVNRNMVCIFGVDITTVRVSVLRDAVAYVPQDAFLFPETISENITGKEYKDLDIAERLKLKNACRDSDIWEYIETLPDGVDTILHESSSNLSGGQRQKIAIARAMYKDAPILLLDEVTASLDTVSEVAVLNKMSESEKTVLMVAHKPRAIDVCDRIIVIDNGQIKGVGSHAYLLENNPTYARLYNSMQSDKGA